MRNARSRLSSSMPVADGSKVVVTSVTSAARAACTASTPPGRSSSCVASPPAAGSRHSAAGGGSASAVARAAMKSRSLSAVNTGADSPFAPRVSRRAGRLPAGSSSQTAADELGALVVEFGDRRDDAGTIGRHRKAGDPRQGEEVVEIVEGCRGHVLLVARVSALVRAGFPATATAPAPTSVSAADTSTAAFQPAARLSPTCVAITTNSVMPTAAPR